MEQTIARRQSIVPVRSCHWELSLPTGTCSCLSVWQDEQCPLLTRWLFVPPATLLHPWFTPAQDGLQHSCCKQLLPITLPNAPLKVMGLPGSRLAPPSAAAFGKEMLLILSPLLAAPQPSCQEDGLTHQCIHFKPTPVSPRLTPQAQCHNTQNRAKWSQIQA